MANRLRRIIWASRRSLRSRYTDSHSSAALLAISVNGVEMPSGSYFSLLCLFQRNEAKYRLRVLHFSKCCLRMKGNVAQLRQTSVYFLQNIRDVRETFVDQKALPLLLFRVPVAERSIRSCARRLSCLFLIASQPRRAKKKWKNLGSFQKDCEMYFTGISASASK